MYEHLTLNDFIFDHCHQSTENSTFSRASPFVETIMPRT